MNQGDVLVIAGVVLAGVAIGAVIASGGTLAAPLATLAGAGATALKAAA